MSQKENIVFFFGAGASASEGGPTSQNLLKEFLKYNPNNRIERRRYDNIKQYLSDIYQNNGDENVPRFEEILGPIDIALEKQEQFSKEWDYNKHLKVRDDLIFSIGSVLKNKLDEHNQYHEIFIQQLFNYNSQNNEYNFISLNYDILLDNALLNQIDDINLDYGINFKNPYSCMKGEKKVYLLKLHGSLNWLYCPTCNSIKYTSKEKAAANPYSKKCEYDGSIQRPIVVPPTYLKTYSNPHISKIWLEAEKLLQKATIIIFIGYSMPESDIHVQYLLKKSLLSGVNQHPKIIVIDKEETDGNTTSEVKDRYHRLFGNMNVNYQPIGFEIFSSYIDLMDNLIENS